MCGHQRGSNPRLTRIAGPNWKIYKKRLLDKHRIKKRIDQAPKISIVNASFSTKLT